MITMAQLGGVLADAGDGHHGWGWRLDVALGPDHDVCRRRARRFRVLGDGSQRA